MNKGNIVQIIYSCCQASGLWKVTITARIRKTEGDAGFFELGEPLYTTDVIYTDRSGSYARLAFGVGEFLAIYNRDKTSSTSLEQQTVNAD